MAVVTVIYEGSAISCPLLWLTKAPGDFPSTTGWDLFWCKGYTGGHPTTSKYTIFASSICMYVCMISSPLPTDNLMFVDKIGWSWKTWLLTSWLKVTWSRVVGRNTALVLWNKLEWQENHTWFLEFVYLIISKSFLTVTMVTIQKLRLQKLLP